MDVDPRLLRYFAAVAEDLHFSKASARLGVTQPALSAAIRRLEASLGVQLFTRSTRQVRLSAAGEALLPVAAETVAAHDRLAVALDRARTDGLPLRFGTLGVFDTLTTVLGELCAVRPDLSDAVRIENLNSDEQAQALLREEIDFGVGRLHTVPDGLRAEVLRLDPLSAAVHADSALAALPAIPSGKLILNRPARSSGQDSWSQFIDRLIDHVPDVVVVDGGGAGLPVADLLLRRARRDGLAIMRLASFLPFPGDVVVRPIEGPQIYHPWYLLTRADDPDPRLPAVREVARKVAEQLGWLQVDTTRGRPWFPEEIDLAAEPVH